METIMSDSGMAIFYGVYGGLYMSLLSYFLWVLSLPAIPIV